MARKKFVQLMESNIMILDRLAGRLNRDPARVTGIPRQQMSVLVRLYVGGRARLKDIARREDVPTPNLCIAFRKLEQDNLILRSVDENDRRNTWYQVTEKGELLAKKAMEIFREQISEMFKTMSVADEEKMTQALQTMYAILSKME